MDREEWFTNQTIIWSIGWLLILALIFSFFESKSPKSNPEPIAITEGTEIG